MKKMPKIFFVILMLVLAVSAFMLTSFADDAEPTAETSEYAYSITHSGGKVEFGKTSEEFVAHIAAMNDASICSSCNGTCEYTIKLLSDFEVVKDEAITLSKGRTYYIDLNGHTYKHRSPSLTKATNFSVNGGAKVYLYSSLPGGKMFNLVVYATRDNSGNITSAIASGHAVFSTSGNFTLNIGTWDGAAHSGDNLSVYTNLLIDDTGGSSASSVVNIKGGSYYRTAPNSYALFTMRSNGNTINVSDATLYSMNYLIGSVCSNPSYSANINIDNCVLYSRTNTLVSVQTYPHVNVNITNSWMLSPLGRTDCVNLGGNNRFTSSEILNVNEGYTSARTKEQKKFTFEYNVPSVAYDENGTPFISDASFEMHTEEIIKVAECITAPKSETSTITWKVFDKTVVETWLNGVMPTTPLTLPDETESSYFTFGVISAANGDKTYVANQYAKFSTKSNITLYSDFIYNIYVPTSAQKYISAVTIAGVAYSFADAPVGTINGVPYYCFSYGISAPNAAKSFIFAMTVKGYNGEDFVQEHELSIPNYSYAVLKGGYNESTKALIKSTLAYVKAVADYFGEDSSAIDSVNNAKDVLGTPMGDVDSSISSVISGVAPYFADKFKYRFNSATATVEKSVTFVYTEKGRTVTKVVPPSEWTTDSSGTYYEISLRAQDIRNKITVKVGSASFDYSFENYVYYILNETSYQQSYKTLLNNLWAYSEASESYISAPPTVDITVAGNSIRNYKIVASSEKEIAAANILASYINAKLNVMPEIVSEYDGAAIRINMNEYTPLYDFKVSEQDGSLVIDCVYSAFIESATESFAGECIASVTGSYDFGEGYTREWNKPYLAYEDFGAKGDGVTNDFAALKATHDAANMKKYPVKADSSKTYYIGDNSVNGIKTQIEIETNTDFGTAKFIIDDTNLVADSSAVFSIKSDYISHSVSKMKIDEINAAGSINKDSFDRIDLGLGYPAMLILYNSGHKVYIRYGGNANSGSDQAELVLIDKDGYVDESTPLLLNYDKITSIHVQPVLDEPITVRGGTFTTLASTVDLKGDYKNIFRGFSITRSNVTLENVEHVVLNEIDCVKSGGKVVSGGHSYSGFFSINKASNVTVDSCIFQGRKYYVQGTYDIGLYMSNNVVFKNCTQSNFYEKDSEGNDTTFPNIGICWGVMGSNYCKNMVYDSCKLTRYDAHSGVVNGAIINSTVSAVTLTGGGEMNIENSVLIPRSAAIIQLRSDYGSTWRGNINISDVEIRNPWSSSTYSEMTLVSAVWVNHNFGYETFLPNLTVDNVTFSGHSKLKTLYVIKVSNGHISQYNSGSTNELDVLYKDVNAYNSKNFNIIADPTEKIPDPTLNRNVYTGPDYIKVYNKVAGITYKVENLSLYDFTVRVGINGYGDSPLVDVD